MYHGRDMVDIPADFCVTMWKTDRKTASCAEISAVCTGYGIWNLCIFGSDWAVRRTINRTMNGINACIQHLIDGQKKQFFGNGRRIFFGEISKPDLEAV